MSARYDKVTLEFYLEFQGSRVVSVAPTYEQTQDPRFQEFLKWFREIQYQTILAEVNEEKKQQTLMFI